MAEEKKFADEMLSDEELDSVAGGTWIERDKDMDDFESLGVKIYCRDIGIPENDKYTWDVQNLFAAFEKYGVKMEAHFLDETTPNKYFVGGKEVSREDAWKHIKSQLGK